MNQKEMFECLGEIDGELIESADQDTKKKSARILRRAWLIAAAILLVAAILIPVAVVAANKAQEQAQETQTPTEEKLTEEKEIVLPPVREGAGTMKLSFVKSFNFEESIEDSDLIAVLQIGNWLREDPDLQSTYYEAVVKDCLKGDLSGTIVLKQSGFSKATIKNYPLYTYGDVIFAFMKYDPEEESYWIIGEHLTVFTVAYSQDRAAYLLYKQTYGLSETMKMTDYCSNTDLRKELAADEVLTDPNAAERVYRYPHIYSLNDVREAIVNH